VWLNGATFVPEASKLVIAESLQGQLIGCNVDTGETEIWLEDPRLGKSTDRPLWPGVNGVQYKDGHVFATSSDRAILVRCQVHESTGNHVQGSMTVLAEGLAGDDLAFDEEGNVYVTTNPQQTVLRILGVGLERAKLAAERFTVAGSRESAETAGPTAVAFGRTQKDEKSIYVVTTGGLITAAGDGPGPAREFRVDIGIKGDASGRPIWR
jgi:sugar lactone lactonase YvrE